MPPAQASKAEGVRRTMTDEEMEGGAVNCYICRNFSSPHIIEEQQRTNSTSPVLIIRSTTRTPTEMPPTST